MFTTKQDEWLKTYLVQEGNDIIQYNKFSEAEKVNFSQEIVANIVKSIEEREDVLDTKIIDKSKGDITKLDNYRYIKTSLELLNNMQSVASNEKVPYLNVLNDTHNNLIKYSKDFERGYRTNKTVVKLLYSSIVLSLVQSISFVIATSMDYVKDPIGNYESCLRYNLNKNKNYTTVNIDCLSQFNLMCTNGEMAYFFNRIYTDKSLQESEILHLKENNGELFSEDSLTCLFADVLGTGIVRTLGTLGAVLVLLARIIPTIPELLRMFVSMIYHTRVEMSDYFRLQAEYIELNLERQRNLAEPNKKSIKKQEKIMNNLLKLSDMIDIDQKNATKSTKMQIETENKNISKSIKNNPVQTSNNNVEKIIL